MLISLPANLQNQYQVFYLAVKSCIRKINFSESTNMIDDKINNPEKYKPDYIDDVGDFKKQIKYWL